MRLNTAYLRRGFARMLSGPQALEDVASDSWEVHPETAIDTHPALYPEGALDRISALSPWRSWEVEQGLIDGGVVRHAATRALVLERADLVRGFVYCGASVLRFGQGKASLIESGLPRWQEIADAHLGSVWTGADFFGHFLTDTLTLQLLPPAGATIVGAPGKPYRHEAGYRALLGLDRPDMPERARIDRLTVYVDYGQNAHKTQRYDVLRARVRAASPKPPARPGVFLCRGVDGDPRRLANQDALTDLLDGNGFDILDCDSLDPAEIVHRSLDARIIVGVEGSHLSHGLYPVAAGGALLVLQPPDRFAMPYKEVADALGLRFGFVVGHPAAEGFSVDLDEVRLMLDRLTS